MGENAFAIGLGTKASGFSSVAEGARTNAEGSFSHAEGDATIASGYAAHAQGYGNTASGPYAHAEGWLNKATGESSHAEGLANVASGSSSHTEGTGTAASSTAAHAEGFTTIASGRYAHAQGNSTNASGENAHAEGSETIASGLHAHAEGYKTHAASFATHAEGELTAATESGAHAEGVDTVASHYFAHAEGGGTTASGAGAHAEGAYTTASGFFSHAQGVYTTTNELTGAHIMGQYGAADALYSWFLANGDSTTPGLAAKILYDGNAYIDVAWNGGGADYAEMYETESGQPIEPGCFVTFGASGDKIRVAQGSDRYILGITSAAPGFVAGAGELRWQGKFQTDKWGRVLYQEVMIPQLADKSGKVIQEAHVESRPVINPAFNPNSKYVARDKRPEWVKVGLLGRMLVRDDGSLIPGGFCRPGQGGIAMAAVDGYKVLQRTDVDQALIVFR